MVKFDGDAGGDEVLWGIGESEEVGGTRGENIKGASDVNYLVGNGEDTELDRGG